MFSYKYHILMFLTIYCHINSLRKVAHKMIYYKYNKIFHLYWLRYLRQNIRLFISKEFE